MPALTFDDVTPGGSDRGFNDSTRLRVSSGSQSPNVLTFDDVSSESGAQKALSTVKDVGTGIVSGLDKGVAGLAGLPADAALGLAFVLNHLQAKAQGRPFSEVEAENENSATFVKADDVRKWSGSEAHKNSPLNLKTTTQAGESAKNIAEFVPGAVFGPGSLARKLALFGLAPGAVSEVAGNLPGVKGSAAEPFVRGGAALATGVGGAIATSGGTTGRVLQRATEGVTERHLDEAEWLFQQAQQMNLPITRAEALDFVTGGGTGLGNIQRVVEGSGQMRPAFSQRPGQIDDAARAAFDDIVQAPADPSQLGPTVQNVARQAVADSPEGRVLSNSLWEAGPRRSPEEAGTIIQNELENVRRGREGMRSALADRDYTAAREAPADVPLDGGFGFREVTQHFEPPPTHPITRGDKGRFRRKSDDEIAAEEGRYAVPVHPRTRGEDGRIRRLTDEEIAAEEARRQQTLEGVRAERQARFNVTEEMPVIGLSPTQFAQVDARPVAAHIDEALQTAKGAVRQGLAAARSALMTPQGAIDTTVEGLHNSRKAITDLISQAQGAGARQTVIELEDSLRVLDQALEQVPAYGAARRNFRAASEPLAPFEDGRVPGRIVERDQFNQRFEMPAERAPDAIAAGGTGAADFNAVATPRAREAFEHYLTTQILDDATRSGDDVSSAVIRRAISQNEDVLRQHPGARERLENIAIARDGLARVQATPLGRLAARNTTVKEAIEALFPQNPIANSQAEIGRAVGELSTRNPTAARELVRTYVETVFNEATQRLASGANEFGGAKFAAVLRGNPQQAANLEAAVRALPRGDRTWDGFDRFLTILEAQGQRQRIGSNTSFNNELLSDMKRGGAVGETLPVVAGVGIKLPQKFVDAAARWRLGKNIDQLANLFTNPEAGPLFRQLVLAPQGSAKSTQIAARLTNLATQRQRTDEKK